MERVKVKDSVGAEVVRNRGEHSDCVWKGIYELEVVRAKDGSVEHYGPFENLIPTQGRRYLLNAALDGESGDTKLALKTDFFVQLHADEYTVLPTNTYQSPGFTEFTNYTGERKEWFGVLDGANASITNTASKAIFTVGVPGQTTIWGAALNTGPTGGLSSGGLKSNTAGDEALISSSQFTGGVITVGQNDVVNVTITLQLN